MKKGILKFGVIECSVLGALIIGGIYLVHLSKKEELSAQKRQFVQAIPEDSRIITNYLTPINSKDYQRQFIINQNDLIRLLDDYSLIPRQDAQRANNNNNFRNSVPTQIPY